MNALGSAGVVQGGSAPEPEAPPQGTFAILAGGGTAGHVLPALSVAEALVAKGRSRAEILFVGARRGQEAALVPPAGFDLRLLAGRGFSRRPSLANLAAAGDLLAAVAASVRLVGERRPAVVVAVGGYASVAPALAARLLGVPLVVLNVDAEPGAANRLLARLATLSAAAWEGSGLPRAVVTGAPLRAALANADGSAASRRRARESLGLPQDRRLVVVVGGSLGSATLNTAAAELARIWGHRGDIALWHVVGRRDWPLVAPGHPGEAGAPEAGRLLYHPVEYEERMADVLVAADVVVARSGAGSVAELAAVGRPAVLVPFPKAPGDHQAANAAVLCAAGAALMLRDEKATGARLASLLEGLLASPGRLESMGRAAAALGRRDAAERVAQLVEEVARRPRRSLLARARAGSGKVRR